MAVHSRHFRGQCRSHGLDAPTRQRLAPGRAAGGRRRRLRRSADRRGRASHRSSANHSLARRHPAIERCVVTVALAGTARTRRSRRLGCRRAVMTLPTRIEVRPGLVSSIEGAVSFDGFGSTLSFTPLAWRRGSIADTSATGWTRETSAGQLPAIDPAPFSSPVRVPSTGRATHCRW